jgi:hypothetical protein
LAALPVGTATNPNVVVLEGFDVSSDTWGTTVKDALAGVQKYITLDLRNCTAANNSIDSSYANTTNNKFNTIKSPYIVGLILPLTLKEIGTYACRDWPGLRYVTIPSGVETIETYAFSGDSNITSITIPDTVTRIRGSAFNGTGLVSVTIPASVQSITEHGAFLNTPLTSVTFLGSSTTVANYYTFNGFFNGVTTYTTSMVPEAGTYIKDGNAWIKQ